MNLLTARRILDGHKEGREYSLLLINKALELTGDLPEGSAMVDSPVQTKGVEGICMARSQENGR